MRIGLRTIKTALAIFISTMIYFSLLVINKELSTWFSPFFCSIAAAFTIQPGRNISLQMGKRRLIGSLIGGICGMFLVACTSIFKNSDNYLYLFSYYVIVSLGVLILIPFTLKLKQKDATFVTVLTYCSITLGVYYLPQVQYGVNRILSTVIGIGIACLISAYRMPRKNQNILFTCAINTLQEEMFINSKVKYKLNYLYDYNTDIVFTTDYSEAELDEILKDVNIKNKMIVLNGAALYDSKTKTYHNVKSLSISEKNDIDLLLENNNIFALRYVITNHFNKLNIFYNKDLPKHYMEIDESLEYDYTNADVLKDTSVTQYHIIDTKENINKIKEIFNNYLCTIRKYNKEYYSLYINSNDTSKLEQVNFLNEENKQVISFIHNDEILFDISKEVYCIKTSDDKIKKISKEILKDNNSVVDKIRKLYFKK